MSIFVEKQLRPEERLKSLLAYSGRVEVDWNVSAKLYYKSGLNMYKQFNIFYKEGSWENALCIYLKYEKLFFDKIKEHPEYGKIPVNVKSINATNFRIIKPKAEHVKRELFKQYKQEYLSYIEELKAEKRKEIEADSNNKDENTMESSKRQIKVVTIDGIEPIKENKIVEAVNPALVISSPHFQIKSEVSFNTSRKMAALETQKKTILMEEEELKLGEISTRKTVDMDSPNRPSRASKVSLSLPSKDGEDVPSISNSGGIKNVPGVSTRSSKSTKAVRQSLLKSPRTSKKTTQSSITQEMVLLRKMSQDSLD